MNTHLLYTHAPCRIRTHANVCKRTLWDAVKEANRDGDNICYKKKRKKNVILG